MGSVKRKGENLTKVRALVSIREFSANTKWPIILFLTEKKG